MSRLGIVQATLWFAACAQSTELHQPGLKADLNVDFPRGSTLIQYVYYLLLCSRTLLDSPKDTIYLFQQLAVKRRKVSKDKLQFCLLQVKYLSHFYLKLLINPENIQKNPILSSSKNKKQLRGCVGLNGYCWQLGSKFFINGSTSICLIKIRLS